MIVYAIRALLNALAPLIGAEEESGGKAVSAGWAEDADPDKLASWTKKGLELASELDKTTQETTAVEYGYLMRKRLGLRRQDPTDESKLFKPFLELMDSFQLDFHSTFRTLSNFKPSLLALPQDPTPSSTESKESPVSIALHQFITKILSATPEPQRLDHKAATGEWLGWLERYATRIKDEEAEWTASASADIDNAREHEMKNVNPRFVLRQWLLEEVISKVERDSDSGKRVLAKVMHMACNPFEPWGAEDVDGELNNEEKEERRYCGLGEKKMLGFQCSCSS